MRLIEGHAISRHLKKWPVKGLCGRCLSVPEPPTPHCIRVHWYSIQYTYAHREKGRATPGDQREG